MQELQHRRIAFIDLTKGLCILLVVMIHIGGAFELFDSKSLITCFCMPLYFFVSGLFFKSYEGFAGFSIRRINSLLIPFLIFYIGSFILMYVISKIRPGTFQLPVRFDELLLVLRGHELIRFDPSIWFLVALFNCNILFYILHYLRRKHLSLLFVVVGIVGVAGFYLGKQQITLPLYLDVAMTAMPFYFAGFWIRRYNFFLFPHHRFDKLIPLFVIAAAVVLYFMARPVGMRTNNYGGNLFQFYIAAFAGIFTIMLLCKKMNRVSVISYLGRYSIITLGVHGPLLHLFRPLLTPYIHNQWLFATLLLLLTLLVCLLVTPLIIRFIPQLAAQKGVLKLARKPQ